MSPRVGGSDSRVPRRRPRRFLEPRLPRRLHRPCCGRPAVAPESSPRRSSLRSSRLARGRVPAGSRSAWRRHALTSIRSGAWRVRDPPARPAAFLRGGPRRVRSRVLHAGASPASTSCRIAREARRGRLVSGRCSPTRTVRAGRRGGTDECAASSVLLFRTNPYLVSPCEMSSVLCSVQCRAERTHSIGHPAPPRSGEQRG